MASSSVPLARVSAAVAMSSPAEPSEDSTPSALDRVPLTTVECLEAEAKAKEAAATHADAKALAEWTSTVQERQSSLRAHLHKDVQPSASAELVADNVVADAEGMVECIQRVQKRQAALSEDLEKDVQRSASKKFAESLFERTERARPKRADLSAKVSKDEQASDGEAMARAEWIERVQKRQTALRTNLGKHARGIASLEPTDLPAKKTLGTDAAAAEAQGRAEWSRILPQRQTDRRAQFSRVAQDVSSTEEAEHDDVADVGAREHSEGMNRSQGMQADLRANLRREARASASNATVDVPIRTKDATSARALELAEWTKRVQDKRAAERKAREDWIRARTDWIDTVQETLRATLGKDAQASASKKAAEFSDNDEEIAEAESKVEAEESYLTEANVSEVKVANIQKDLWAAGDLTEQEKPKQKEQRRERKQLNATKANQAPRKKLSKEDIRKLVLERRQCLRTKDFGRAEEILQILRDHKVSAKLTNRILIGLASNSGKADKDRFSFARASLIPAVGKKILVQREKTKNGKRWSDFGGKPEEGEDALECALREFREESAGFLSSDACDAVEQRARQTARKPAVMNLYDQVCAIYMVDSSGLDLSLIETGAPNSEGVSKVKWVNPADPSLRRLRDTRAPLRFAIEHVVKPWMKVHQPQTPTAPIINTTVQRYVPRSSASRQSFHKLLAASSKPSQWEKVLSLHASMVSEGVTQDLFTFRTIIGAYRSGQLWQSALSLFEEMPAAHVAPDLRVFEHLISACVKDMKWEQMLLFLEELRETGMESTVAPYSQVILACGKAHQWERGLSVFDEMREEGVAADGLCYGLTLAQCRASGKWERAVLLLDEMRMECMTPHMSDFHSAIHACRQSQQWQVAVSLLRQVQAANLRPNKQMFDSAISACKEAEEWESALRLLKGATGAFTKSKGSAVTPVTSPVVSFSLPPSWERMLVLLENLCEVGATGRATPTDVFFDQTISACAKADQWQHALSLIQTMRADCVTPLVHTFTSTIMACRGAHQWKQMLSVFEEMREAGITPPLMLLSKVVLACEEVHDWEIALSVLEDMRAQGATPNVNTFSSAIKSCEGGQQWDHASALLTELRTSHTLKEAASDDKEEIAQADNTSRKGLSAKKHRKDSTKKIDDLSKQSKPRSIKEYHAGIGSLCRSSDWSEALRLFSNMGRDGLEPRAFTYNAAILSCKEGKQWKRAIQLLEEMRAAELLPDLFSYREALSSCKEANELETAMALYEAMCARGVTADAGIFAVAMSVSQKCRPWHHTLSLLTDMQALHISPGQFCFDAGLAACEQGLRWQHALTLLRQMREHEHAGCKPKGFAYRKAISTCEKCSQWDQTLALLEEMTAAGVTRDAICYSASLAACKADHLGWRRATSLLQQMKAASVSANKYVFGRLIEVFSIGGQWERALSFLHDASLANATPHKSSFESAISACTRAKQWASAMSLMNQMRKLGMTPDLTTINRLNSMESTMQSSAGKWSFGTGYS